MGDRELRSCRLLRASGKAFGLVHRGVGSIEQLARCDPMIGVHGDANTE
jgi:hypothetical protein